MKKKILFVITKSVWGGAGKYVYDLVTNLPTDNFDIAVAAGGEGPLFQKLQSAGVRTIRISELDRDIHIGKELSSFRALLCLFQQEQPDVIHLNSSKIGGLGALAGRIASWRSKKKMKIIFTVHGWVFLEDRSILWRATALLASWASTLLQDKIILINSRDYAAAQKFVPRRKRAFIHNGINEANFLPRSNGRAFFTTSLGLPITDDTVFIGTIAELTANKGLHYLIDAVKLLSSDPNMPSIHLFIIGEGEERPELEAKIKNLGLEHVIILLGFNNDARSAIGGLDIFVLPSLKEGLPYAIMEAMTVGLPVIASNVGGIPDLVSHNETGMLVPPKNPKALAEAIRLLAQNRERRMTFGKRAGDIVRTKFPLHAMLEKTQQLYETAY